MSKKMLSVEEIETQMVLELPDRQLMRTLGIEPAAKASDLLRGPKLVKCMGTNC